jgi:hypothetical protein
MKSVVTSLTTDRSVVRVHLLDTTQLQSPRSVHGRSESSGLDKETNSYAYV